jgi:hypothetical protein
MVARSSLTDTPLIKSPFGNLVKEIKNFFVSREFKPMIIARVHNRVAQ